VHDDPIARMAAASELSDSAVKDIWRQGSPRARCTIAGRARLPLSVTLEILASDDGDLLTNWLSTERGKEHTAQVVVGRRLEVDRALTYQDNLTAEQRTMLSWSDSTEVLKPLLLREDLTEKQRDRALMRYISRERILRGSYGEELINTIETAGNLDNKIDRRWSRLMEIVGPEQAGLIVEAAERGIRNPIIAHSAAKALKRLASLEEIETNPPAVRDLHRATMLTLRTPHLPVAMYTQLADISVLEPLKPLLLKRCELDVASALELLTCGEDAAACTPGHAAIIAVLSTIIDEVDFPRNLLPAAALAHSDELPGEIIDRVLDSLPFSARLMEREEALGRIANQASLIEHRLDLYDPAKTHPVELVRELARGGSRALLQRNSSSTQRDPVGANIVLECYQPVGDLLDDAYYSGRVAERLLVLKSEEREFVTRLISEWTGSLLELIEAAKTV
jgi:hypothetical protein